MKYKIKVQLLELIAMLKGGYTTNVYQLKRLLGIETNEEKKCFIYWLKELEMIGCIERLDDDRIYIV